MEQKTMNVSELVEKLQELPPDAEILIWDTYECQSFNIEQIVEECGSRDTMTEDDVATSTQPYVT